MDEAAGKQAIAGVLMAVSEAKFFFAEEKRAAVDSIPPPAPRGDDLGAYALTLVTPWVLRKHAAIDEAEKAYVEILDLQPVPPPRWVVDAAARVARMRAKLAAEIRRAADPEGVEEGHPRRMA